MKTKYDGLKQGMRKWAKVALAVYAISGSAANSINTGHPSADNYMGITQPSQLEKVLLNSLDIH